MDEQFYGQGYTPQFDGRETAIAAALTPTPSMSFAFKQQQRQRNAMMAYQFAQMEQQRQQSEQKRIADIASALEKVRQTPMPLVNKKAYFEKQLQPLLNEFQTTLSTKYGGNLSKFLNSEGFAIPLKLNRLAQSQEYLIGVNNQEQIKAAREAYLKGEIPKGEFNDSYNKLLSGDSSVVLEWKGGYKPKDLSAYVSKKDHPTVVGGMVYEIGKGWKSAPELSAEEKQREIRALYSDSTLSDKDLQSIYKQYEDVPLFYKRDYNESLAGGKYEAQLKKDAIDLGLRQANLNRQYANDAFNRQATNRRLNQADQRLALAQSSQSKDEYIQSPYNRFFTPNNNEESKTLPKPIIVVSGGKNKAASSYRRIDVSASRTNNFDDFIYKKTGVVPKYEMDANDRPIIDPLTKKPKVKEYYLESGGSLYGFNGKKYSATGPKGRPIKLKSYNPDEIFQFYDDKGKLLSYGIPAEVKTADGSYQRGFIRIDEVSPEAIQGLNMQSNIGVKNKLGNAIELGQTLPLDVSQD